MKDFVPLGTGNSRFLKTVNNAKALYPTYDAFLNAMIAGTLPIDLNGINAAGVAQVGTPLNKQNLLQDTTAAALGLSSSATVNDALNKLSASALVGVDPTCLDSKKVGETITLNETVNGVSAPATFIILSKNYNNTGRALVARQTYDARFSGAFNSAGTGVYAGSTIDSFYTTYLGYLDADVQSQITNVNIPVTTVDATATVGNISRKVFALSTSELNLNNVAADGTALPYYTSGGTRWFGAATWTRTIHPNSNTLTYQNKTENNSGVSSKDSTAYYIPAFTLPLDFVVEEKLYFVDAHGEALNIGVKIETGSYVGTGEYGSNDPNTLTFGFVPYLVIIFFSNYAMFFYRGNRYATGFTPTGASFTTTCLGWYVPYVSWNGNTLSWYSTDGGTGADAQMNSGGRTYNYLAIGM